MVRGGVGRVCCLGIFLGGGGGGGGGLVVGGVGGGGGGGGGVNKFSATGRDECYSGVYHVHDRH